MTVPPNKQFLYSYLNAFAPVAQENEGQKIWKDYVNPFVDEMHMDAYGTTYGVRYAVGSGYGKNTPKVVIEAHADEIAWIITHIEEDGYIRVKRHGGSDNMIAPSMTVVVHNDKGEKIPGVFGWPAIHTRKAAAEKGYEQEELWVDVGASSKERVMNDLHINAGCLITFDDPLKEIGDYYVGRSLDNKIGGYIIAEAARRIYEEGIKLPFDLYVVNSVQEEVGLHGAKMIAKRLQADLALVHDVCHNTNHPKMNKAKDGDVKGGKGPALEYTAQNHRKIIQKFIDVAKVNDIPFQRHVGSYGNDTMAFFLENTPTAIAATPLKYMHSTVEMAHKADVNNCIDLFVETLKSITPEFIDEVHNR